MKRQHTHPRKLGKVNKTLSSSFHPEIELLFFLNSYFFKEYSLPIILSGAENQINRDL